VPSDSGLIETRTNAEHSETGAEFRVSYESQCSLYFIGAEEGPVKIGYARDLWARFRGIQNSCPIELKVLAACVGGRMMEREYHRRFAEHRLHGEWFERVPALAEEIDLINRTQIFAHLTATPRFAPVPYSLVNMRG
jgi:hypothetical protein